MATVRLLSDEELSPEARAVFADIRTTRQSDFVNNFWRALAHDPKTLHRTWENIKEVMAPGALDPKIKEMLYVAVSVAHGCSYCIHSHTAAARATTPLTSPAPSQMPLRRALRANSARAQVR